MEALKNVQDDEVRLPTASSSYTSPRNLKHSSLYTNLCAIQDDFKQATHELYTALDNLKTDKADKG